MRARTRDFIYTSDNLFFAVTSYLHPADRILAFLRYIPDPDGERSVGSNRYSKVNSEAAYLYLEENHPEYLHYYDELGVLMMGVPYNRVKRILNPVARLKEILAGDKNSLLSKVAEIAHILHDEARIPYRSMGVSGSILPSLYDPENSDIDFVVYGLENHKKALETFGEMKSRKDSKLRALDSSYWKKVYSKRIVDRTLSFEEFCWYEMRKNNRGLINGTLFDILATREWVEIKGSWADTSYTPIGNATVECMVTDALAAFDNPATYHVEDVRIISGPEVEINQVVSFTHTYAGQAREGERIIARGKVEKFEGPTEGYRLVVGTTRESLNEFIKLKDLKIDNI